MSHLFIEDMDDSTAGAILTVTAAIWTSAYWKYCDHPFHDITAVYSGGGFAVLAQPFTWFFLPLTYLLTTFLFEVSTTLQQFASAFPRLTAFPGKVFGVYLFGHFILVWIYLIGFAVIAVLATVVRVVIGWF
jgi:hypothetical protein